MKKNLFFFLLCLFACTNNNKKDAEIIYDGISETVVQTIDLSNPIFTDDKMLLSDLVEDAEYIKLETTEEALVKTGKTIIDDDYIYILNDVLYLFSRKDGSFVRKIGKIGQGPGEFKLAISFSIADGKVYIRTNYQPKIFIYDVNTGVFLGDIDCTNSSLVIFVHKNQNITLLRRLPTYENQFSFMNINHKGDTLLFKSPKIKLPDEIIEKRFGPHLPFITTFWASDSHLNCYDSMTDTVYAINGDSYRSRFHIKRGKYGMDPLKYFSTDWGKTGSERGWNDYIKMDSFIESSQYIYILLDYKDTKTESHWARYDKKTGEVKWWRNKIVEENPELTKFFWTKHFYNDFDGGRDVIFHVNEQFAVAYISEPPFEKVLTIEDFATSKPLYPDKQAKLKSLVDEMGEDDNPTIVIYKLK